MELLKALKAEFYSVSDQSIALKQSAYMRDQFPFLGIKKPLRARIQKEVFHTHPLSTEHDLIVILASLWKEKEREFQYTALDLAYRYKKLWTPAIFTSFKECICTKSWWDTVDTIASKLIGTLLATYPELQNTMDLWIDDDTMWLRRTALIYQLSYKENTDKERLFNYCKKRMCEQEFFIRKAIGWALRQYSRTNPNAVREFIAQEKKGLSPLSYREASKYCQKQT